MDADPQTDAMSVDEGEVLEEGTVNPVTQTSPNLVDLKNTLPAIKSFRIEGPILPTEAETTYYIRRDLVTRLVTSLMNRIDAKTPFAPILIEGPRMSGKTTAIFDLAQRIQQRGLDYIILLPKSTKIAASWQDLFGGAVSSKPQLLEGLKPNPGGQPSSKVPEVLLIDNADRLSPDLLPQIDRTFDAVILFATAFRSNPIGGFLSLGDQFIKDARKAGEDYLLPFTLEETTKLLSQFAPVRRYQATHFLSPFGMFNIFIDTGGHPGLVCAFGKALEDLMTNPPPNNQAMKDYISAASSQVAAGPAFQAMIDSLVRRFLDQGQDNERGLNLLRSICYTNGFNNADSFDPSEVQLLMSLGFAQKEYGKIQKLSIKSELLKKLVMGQIFVLMPKLGYEVPVKQDGKLDFPRFLTSCLKLFDSDAIKAYSNEKIAPKEQVMHEQMSFAMMRWFHQVEGWSVLSEYSKVIKGFKDQSAKTKSSGEATEGKSLDLLVRRDSPLYAYKAGIELLRGSNDIEGHATRDYPSRFGLNDYIVVAFRVFAERGGTESAAENDSFTFFVDSPLQPIKSVQVFHVLYSQDFGRVILVFRDPASENKRNVIHVFGSFMK